MSGPHSPAPVEVDGWRVDGATASDDGVHCDLRIDDGRLTSVGPFSRGCPTCHGTDVPLPVLAAMLRAVGWRVEEPGK